VLPDTAYHDPASQDRSAGAVAAWRQRWERAQHVGRPGDLWLLAAEAPDPQDALRAGVDTARALWACQQAALAREQLAGVLSAAPRHAQALSLRAWFERAPTSRPEPASELPRAVLLGAGHRVDCPGRMPPRLPATRVGAVRNAIEAVLDEWAVGPEDLAVTAGAAGSDLLFAEGCLNRGARLELMLPLPEAEFVAASLLSSADGDDWHRRYLAVKDRLPAAPRVLGEAVGPGPAGSNPYQRFNQWLLNTARGRGADRLSCVFVWDGGLGDGPGGTRDLVERARRHAVRMNWIDLRRLGLPAG
jgi:hypothetical protein